MPAAFLPLIQAGLKDGAKNTERRNQFDSNIFSLLGSAITGRQPKDFGGFQQNDTVANLATGAQGFINAKAKGADLAKAGKSSDLFSVLSQANPQAGGVLTEQDEFEAFKRFKAQQGR